MNPEVSFTKSQLAPCGINCGTCRAHLRAKNVCPGCQVSPGPTISHCSRCAIRNCDSLKKTTANFCYECPEFPCAKIIQIDSRYRKKYRISLIGNLKTLSVTDTETYLLLEKTRWTCTGCGSVLCVHNTICLKCRKEYQEQPGFFSNSVSL